MRQLDARIIILYEEGEHPDFLEAKTSSGVFVRLMKITSTISNHYILEITQVFEGKNLGVKRSFLNMTDSEAIRHAISEFDLWNGHTVDDTNIIFDRDYDYE